MNGQDIVLVKINFVTLLQVMKASFDECIVHDAAKEFPFPLRDSNPEVLAPSPRRNILHGQWQQSRRMFVPQDRLFHLAVATWARAFLGSIFMGRKPRRINSDFDKVSDANVLLQDRMWDLKSLAMFGVHRNPADQFVAVAKLLLVELLLKGGGHWFDDFTTANGVAKFSLHFHSWRDFDEGRLPPSGTRSRS